MHYEVRQVTVDVEVEVPDAEDATFEKLREKFKLPTRDCEDFEHKFSSACYYIQDALGIHERDARNIMRYLLLTDSQKYKHQQLLDVTLS